MRHEMWRRRRPLCGYFCLIVPLVLGGLILPAQAPAPADSKAAEPPAAPQPAPEQPAGKEDSPVPPSAPAAPSPAAPAPAPPAAPDVQLSFAGAEIDAVIRWLAEATGKSIVKHKTVACQLTIVSSKKLPLRDAIDLVYRALALEGFSVIEDVDSIVILPEAMEAKMGARIADGSGDSTLEGRQIVVRVFQLEHAQAAKLSEKLKGVLTDKGKLSVEERGNKVIVTDFADNVRLVSELLKELDVATFSDAVIEIIPLKHAEAESLAALVSAIYGAGKGPGAAVPAGAPAVVGQPPAPGGAIPASGGDGVRILADRSVNRLIVTAPQKSIAEIRALIEKLDSEKPADVTLRVITLEHVSAKDLVQEVAPLYTKLRGESLKDVIEITANSRSNSLIVLSSEANYKAIKDLIASLDTKEAQEKEMKSFSLQNADAEDVADQLTELYQKQDNSYFRYWYYDSRSQSQDGEVRFVADRRKNTVIVTAPPALLESIEQMIKALDEPVEGEDLVPKIYPLKYVSAIDVEEVLNQLLLKRRPRRRYYYDDDPEEEDRNVGRLFGKVRIASEPYTNSLIVTSNSPENLVAVEAVLKQLDVPSEAGETTMNVPLKYAKSVALANNINILFAQGGSPPRRQAQPEGRQQGQNPQQPPNTDSTSFELEEEVIEETYYPWLGGQQENLRNQDGRLVRPVSDLVGRVRIVPDIRTNSLLVTTNAHFFPQVLKVVNDLDVPTPQVLIEAKIVEVASDVRDRLGVRWSPDGSRVFDSEDLDDSILSTGSGSYREVFAGTALADAMRTGILDASVSIDFLIQFLRKNTDSRVRAEPRINVADNERGKLFVGSRVPFISGSVNTPEGGRNDTFQYIDV
ncbi:MAG TPA: secretin N-terminal domain-containing protein, partial [Planctomycetota bacterium]|nr:secretin N-terminal domain-containing protein [Planctomycetota bacterium]